MGDVKIAAEQHRLLCLQLAHEVEEGRVPGLPVGQAHQFIAGIGRIDADHKEILVLGGEHPALLVVLLHPHVAGDRQGCLPAEDGDAGVTLAHGGITADVVAVDAVQGGVDLLVLGLGFLQAEHVRIQCFEGFGEIFLDHGAQAIDVPGGNFHRQGYPLQQRAPILNAGAGPVATDNGEKSVIKERGAGLPHVRPECPGALDQQLLDSIPGLRLPPQGQHPERSRRRRVRARESAVILA